MIELDQIDKKVASVLDGYLVRKDLVRTFSRQFPVPTYVVEFMLGRYCASTDQEEIDEGLRDCSTPAQVPHGAGRRGRTVQGQSSGDWRGKDPGDLVTARVDNEGEYVASLPSLRLTDVRISGKAGEPARTHADGGFYAERWA